MGLASNIVGIIGNIISLGFFLSPAPTFYGLLNKKAMEEVEPYIFLFLCTYMNCFVWVYYSLLDGNIFLFITNLVGHLIPFLYLNSYASFASESQKLLVCRILIFEAVLMLAIMFVAMFCFHSHSHRVVFAGIIADVAFTITAFASYPTIWKKVFTTKSVESMHFWLSLAGLSNGICWTIYALLQFDIFILVASGVGAIDGAIQLGLYAYFYFHENNEVTPSEEAGSVV